MMVTIMPAGHSNICTDDDFVIEISDEVENDSMIGHTTQLNDPKSNVSHRSTCIIDLHAHTLTIFLYPPMKTKKASTTELTINFKGHTLQV